MSYSDNSVIILSDSDSENTPPPGVEVPTRSCVGLNRGILQPVESDPSRKLLPENRQIQECAGPSGEPDEAAAAVENLLRVLEETERDLGGKEEETFSFEGAGQRTEAHHQADAFYAECWRNGNHLSEADIEACNNAMSDAEFDWVLKTAAEYNRNNSDLIDVINMAGPANNALTVAADGNDNVLMHNARAPAAASDAAADDDDVLICNARAPAAASDAADDDVLICNARAPAAASDAADDDDVLICNARAPAAAADDDDVVSECFAHAPAVADADDDVVSECFAHAPAVADAVDGDDDLICKASTSADAGANLLSVVEVGPKPQQCGTGKPVGSSVPHSSSSAVTTAHGASSSISVRDIPAFNASELRQRLDFRDIDLNNLERVPERVRESLTDRGGLIHSVSYLCAWQKRLAALGFEDMEKGYFPHMFNTCENEYYSGSYPDPSYYGYDTMTDSEKTTFMKWYVTVREDKFDFQAEIRRYCVNDVEVLRKACRIYRETFLGCTQLDPFAFTTLASSCMGVFKTLFLPRDTLALTYDGAYTTQNKAYSDVSMQWLEYVAHVENIEIRHALNYGEQAFGPYFVDGCNAATNTCYEFAGCFFHGCIKCHVQADENPVAKVLYGELYRQFNDKVDALKKRHGLRVVVMWECEWQALKNSCPSVQAFLAGYKKPERLDPRKALFGGRTNAIKLYHKTENGEKIRYYDFTSLYPTVQAKKLYPVGHPQIILSDFESIDKYFGFVKCTVLPPRGLFHPVLPYKCHSRLMFPLCGTCAEELNQIGVCVHSDAERQLSGVWVSFELQKALEKGYRIVSVDEVWHFPNKTDTLFRDYVKTFLKCKAGGLRLPRARQNSC
ncbi:hypothetical protein L3Q82_004502 [Scortum barcoo]|uniref:Uncharacterized protein n=1 Tax=Scortum barcoo TaxID=214431 RepID=A0ACB8VH61_9TELE|nr:hypothetical protein L3Q82_004502 [Scortum barcoo]